MRDMSVQLPDGRSVGISGYGDPTGAPMFLFTEHLGRVNIWDSSMSHLGPTV